MSYYVRGPDRLGLSAGQTAVVSAGANLIIPGSGPIVAVSSGLLNSLFGGSRDAARKARAEWFEQGGRQNSLIADRILIGGTTNTAGNERGYYADAIDRLMTDARTRPTMEAARRQGGYWDSTDNDRSDKMRALVENELIELGRVVADVPTSSTASSSNAQMLPGMTSTATAPSTKKPNWLLWGGIAAAGVVGLYVVPQFVRPSRRR